MTTGRPAGHQRRGVVPVGAVPAPVLMLASVASLQVGQALGTTLFPIVHPTGVATLRLVFAAVVLGALHREPVPRQPSVLALSTGLGVAIAGMNLIYPALDRSPVGVAVTLQFLGPLTVALTSSRRRADVLWAALAGGGISLFLNPASHVAPSGTGVLLALASGASWAAYILLSRQLARHTTGGHALVPAVAVAALLTAPAGMAMAGVDLLRPTALLTGAGVAVLTAVLPYSLDLTVLRRLPARVYGVLASFEPLLGGIAALILLGEVLTAVQWLAVVCVVLASIGSVTTTVRRDGEGTQSCEAHDRPSGPAAGRRRAGRILDDRRRPVGSDRQGIA